MWRDFASNNHFALCEENRDCDDLVNLNNPARQINHYTKPSSALKSRLKGGKEY